MKKILRLVTQIIILIGFTFVGNGISYRLHLKFPGSIFGMFLLFLLLHFKIIKLSWIDTGAEFLLSQLLLFFIPPVIGIVQFGSLIKSDGLQLLLVIFFSTILVMTVTGGLAEWLFKQRGGKTNE